MVKYLWLAVTNDKLELPICIADTAKELAQQLGVKRTAVTMAASRTEESKSIRRKIYKIELDDNFIRELEEGEN